MKTTTLLILIIFAASPIFADDEENHCPNHLEVKHPGCSICGDNMASVLEE